MSNVKTQMKTAKKAKKAVKKADRTKGAMTPKQHKKFHKRLHDAVMELWFDFTKHNPGSGMHNTNVESLLRWSATQAESPAPKCDITVETIRNQKAADAIEDAMK